MDSPAISSKKCLTDYFQNQSGEFSESFIACRESISADTIHDLRLSLKNLHALFILLSTLDTRRKRKPKFPVPLGRLFSNLGKIRDLQIIEQELKLQEKVLDTRLKKLKSRMKKAGSARTRNMKPMLKNLQFRAEISRINQYLDEIIAHYKDDEALYKNIKSNLQGSWKKILIQLRHRHTQKNLHLVRIQIKRLGYMASVVREDENLISGMPFRLEMLDEFQQLLGNWHDQVVVYNRISKEMQKKRTKKQMKLFFLLGSIKKKRGRMSRRVSVFCSKQSFRPYRRAG